MRPYKDHINPDLRDKLILGISGALPAITAPSLHYIEGWQQERAEGIADR
jgi:hypothetical protein